MPVCAATTERIVVDRHSGLAISGFDPVAYFTDAVPRKGIEDHELSSAGVTWRFRNEGNMAAFVADPDIYTPQFGGYDPVAVARGVAAAGHPQLWLIPLALIILVAEHVNREKLPVASSMTLRYAGLLILYVSSTADMFMHPLGDIPLALALALLSILGIFAGNLERHPFRNPERRVNADHARLAHDHGILRCGGADRRMKHGQLSLRIAEDKGGLFIHAGFAQVCHGNDAVGRPQQH